MSDAPVLRVVHGDPTPEELAVVTALVSAAGGEVEDSATPTLRGRWNDPASRMRQPVRPGPGAWRSAPR